MATGGLYWLSFVRDGKFAGACIVRAPDAPAAFRRATVLKINPGGEVALAVIEPSACEPGFYERAEALKGKLFSKAEVEALFGPTRDVRDTEGMTHICEDCARVDARLN